MDQSDYVCIMFIIGVMMLSLGLIVGAETEKLNEEKILQHVDCKTMIDKSIKDIPTVSNAINDNCLVTTTAVNKP